MDWTKLFSGDDEQEQAPSPLVGPPAADAAPVQPEDPQAPSVKDYISKKFNLAGPPVESASLPAQYNRLANDDSSVNQARSDAADSQRTANIMEGLSTMFAGSKNTDTKFFDKVRGQADTNVARAEKDKQGKLSDFLTADKLAGEEKTNKDYDEQHSATSKSSKLANQLALSRALQLKGEAQAAGDKEGSAQIDTLVGQLQSGTYSANEIANMKILDKVDYKDVLNNQAAMARVKATEAGANARMNHQEGMQKDKLAAEDRKTINSKMKEMNADTKKERDAIDMASDFDRKLGEAATNPVGSNMLPVELAKMVVAGQGRLNQQEIAHAGGSDALLAKASQIAQSMTEGTVTPENLAFMKRLSEVSKASAEDAYKSRKAMHAHQLGQSIGKTPEEAYGILTGGEEYPTELMAANHDTKTPTASGEIKRKDPKSGRTAVYGADKQFIRWEQ